MATMREIFGDHCLGVGVFYGLLIKCVLDIPMFMCQMPLTISLLDQMGHQVMAWWFVSIKLSADAILQPITHSNETYLAELLHSAILLIRNLPKEIWIFFSEFFTLATFRSQPILYEWEDNTNQLYIVSSFQHTTSGGSHIMEVLQNIWAAGCTIIKLFIRCIFILILSTYFLTIWTTSSSCKKCSLPTFCGLNFTDEPQTSALQQKLLIKESYYNMELHML